LEQLRTDCSPDQWQLLQQWQTYAQALQARFAVNPAGV
jgi:exodeoxyribonuclease-1